MSSIMDFNAFQLPTQNINNTSVVDANVIEEPSVDLEHFQDWGLHKVQDITIDQLRQTSRELGGNGAPNNGILHYAFIQKVIDMCNERSLHAEIRDLFACKQGSSQWPGVFLTIN